VNYVSYAANKKDTGVKTMVLVIVLILGIGVALIITGFALRKETAELRKICTEETVGVVTGYYVRDDSEKFYTILEYQVKGQTYTWQSTLPKDKPPYKIGKSVSVFYAPDDPEHAFLSDEHSDASLWFVWGLGALLVVMSVLVIIRMITGGALPAKVDPIG
jgi:hypothetical protein